MQPRNSLALYEERLVCLWQSLVAALGIHTARVLLHRALWQTAQRHPDIALIRYDDAGLCFEAQEMSYLTRPQEEGEGYTIRPQEEIEAAFDDLCAELLLILPRLLGGEMAQRTCAGPLGSRQAGAGVAEYRRPCPCCPSSDVSNGL